MPEPACLADGGLSWAGEGRGPSQLAKVCEIVEGWRSLGKLAKLAKVGESLRKLAKLAKVCDVNESWRSCHSCFLKS